MRKVSTLGSLVRVVRLPKYWGMGDIRGSVGLIIGNLTGTVEADGWCTVLIDGARWTIPLSCLEVLDEAR